MMLSQTFAPLTNFTDDLLSAIADFLRPVIIQFSPGQLGSVAALQLELALMPLRIIASATISFQQSAASIPSADTETHATQGIEGAALTLVEGGDIIVTPDAEILATQAIESGDIIATIDWLKLDEPAPETEPMPNIIDMAKARQQRELPQGISADAFTVMGADGRFTVTGVDDGHLVRRWVQLRKGLHFSQHLIPTNGNCDCKQSELGAICCHHKALKHSLSTQRIEAQVADWKEQERAQRLDTFRYQVIVWRETGTPAEVLWEGPNLEDAEFKLTVAQQQPTVNTAKLYDRKQDADLKVWHRPSPAQVEDARQALGFSTPKPAGDWQSRQQLEDSIVEAASKLGWLPAQATAFQKSTLGLPADSKLTRSEMTAEQLQKVADAFAAALKEKQTEKRRQAAIKGRVA